MESKLVIEVTTTKAGQLHALLKHADPNGSYQTALLSEPITAQEPQDWNQRIVRKSRVDSFFKNIVQLGMERMYPEYGVKWEEKSAEDGASLQVVPGT